MAQGTRRTLLAVSAVVLLLGCEEAPEQVPLQELTIARVGGLEVSRGQFESYLRYGIQLPSEAREDGEETGESQPYTDEVHSRLLDRFLLERAVAQVARRDGATVDRNDLDQFASATGLGSIADMEDHMPLTQREYLLAYLEDSLLVKRELERRLRPASRVADDEARRYYEANAAEFTAPTRIRLKQIHVDAMRDSRDLSRRVRDRDSFIAYAEELSVESEEEQGKDLGLWDITALPESFADAVAELGAGQVSKVFQDPDGGYNVLLVEEHVPGRLMTFEEVRDQLIKNLERERLSEATRAYLARLRNATEITIVHENLGFVYVPPTDAATSAVRQPQPTTGGGAS